jgi:hypothetical protein
VIRPPARTHERAPTPDFIETGFAGAPPGPAFRLLFTLRPVFAYKPSPRTGSGWRTMLLSAGVIGYSSNTADTAVDEKTTVKLADVDRAIVFNRRLDGSPGVLVTIFATIPHYLRRTEITFGAADNLPLQLAYKGDLAWARDGDVPATTNAGLVGQLLANLPPHIPVHHIDLSVDRPLKMPRGGAHGGHWLVFLLPHGILRRHDDGHQFSFLSKEMLDDVRAVWKLEGTASLTFHTSVQRASGWSHTRVSRAVVKSVQEWYAGAGGIMSEAYEVQ